MLLEYLKNKISNYCRNRKRELAKETHMMRRQMRELGIPASQRVVYSVIASSFFSLLDGSRWKFEQRLNSLYFEKKFGGGMADQLEIRRELEKCFESRGVF